MASNHLGSGTTRLRYSGIPPTKDTKSIHSRPHEQARLTLGHVVAGHLVSEDRPQVRLGARALDLDQPVVTHQAIGGVAESPAVLVAAHEADLVTAAKCSAVDVAGEGLGLDAAPHVRGHGRVLGPAGDALGDQRAVSPRDVSLSATS